MKSSARNSLKEKIESITIGAVSYEIVIELLNGMKVDSSEKLNLAECKAVYAVVKASDVMIATD